MKIQQAIYDDFLDPHYFDFVRAQIDDGAFQFGPVTSPVDGVTYPHICLIDPGSGLWVQVMWALTSAMRSPPVSYAMFMRMSPAGVIAPHQAHHDASMGAYSLMLYMNRPEHCVGGTEILRHRQLDIFDPEAPIDPAVWERDTNLPQMWEVVGGALMRSNRGFLFNSALMHRAAPVGGFGSTPRDARLVLTCFFDL